MFIALPIKFSFYFILFSVQSYYRIATFGLFVAVATPRGNISILSLPDLKPIYQHKTSDSKGNKKLFVLMFFPSRN